MIWSSRQASFGSFPAGWVYAVAIGWETFSVMDESEVELSIEEFNKNFPDKPQIQIPTDLSCHQ